MLRREGGGKNKKRPGYLFTPCLLLHYKLSAVVGGSRRRALSVGDDARAFGEMADVKSRAYIFKVASTMLGESSRAVEDSAPDDLVAQFLEAKVVEGRKVDKLLFYAQDKTVICTTGDKEPLTGKCAYVVRVTDEGKPVTVPETDINFGTINGDSTATLQTLTQLMSNVFDPCLASNLFGYVKKMKPNEKEELETLQKKCVVVIDKAIHSLAGGMKLAEIDTSDAELKVRAGPGRGRTAVCFPEICPPVSLAFL